jgi:hypothetical protein
MIWVIMSAHAQRAALVAAYGSCLKRLPASLRRQAATVKLHPLSGAQDRFNVQQRAQCL